MVLAQRKCGPLTRLIWVLYFHFGICFHRKVSAKAWNGISFFKRNVLRNEISSSISCPFGYGGTIRQDVFHLLFNRIFREPKHMENNHTTHSDSEETRYRGTCTPFIKMLRRNSPYGNIIYMKIQLKVTRKWPEDLLSYRFILMKQICETGTIFQWKIHERGTSCQKWYT